jgi:hypothetical protein
MCIIPSRYLTSLLGLCLLWLVLLAGCNTPSLLLQQNQSNTSYTTNAALTILPGQQRITVPPNFIGMNIEIANLCTILRLDALQRSTFEQIFKNLGTGTLHIGGRSADLSIWQPTLDTKPFCQRHLVITKPIVQSLFAFARRIHWKVIWGLNFLINKPQIDADEAQYIASIGGNSLLGFTIGNEPEDFTKHGYRPPAWGYSNYLADWNADRDAILHDVPHARFIGPEACCQSGWLPAFLQDESLSGVLSAASHHYYSYSDQEEPNRHVTIESFLSVSNMNKFIFQARSWVAAADQYNLPVDITELNSITNGGLHGVSDTFGSALWASDILFQSATLGIHQVDFQEVPDAVYAFINSQGVPQAIYHALLFFHLATLSSSFIPTILNTSANITSYAMSAPNHTLRIIFINKTAQQNLHVSFTPPSSYHTLTTLRMRAPSLTSTSGITIDNTTLTTGNTLHIPKLPHVPLNTATIILNVPANSASLFTFLP